MLQPDPTIYDGRFANNGWLQECPKPITKVTWDNAAIMSPRTANDLGVGLGGYAHGGEHGGYHPDVVELRIGERTVTVPVWIMPGHADGAITLYLGYGRDAAGRVGGTRNRLVGVNAYPLRTPAAAVVRAGDDGAQDRAATARGVHPAASAHGEPRAGARGNAGRVPAQRPTSRTSRKPRVHHEAEHGVRVPLSMYDASEHPYEHHKWGMAIDLTACIGCHACVVACQAENNIPVVGKEQVAAGREMHWLRDRSLHQRPARRRRRASTSSRCRACTARTRRASMSARSRRRCTAPRALTRCSISGCVGTRFCSNNCPYKVRRFNFFFYADYNTPSVRQQYNPDVTVRSRGVMEKCSYCVQRIRHAEIDAQVENRPDLRRRNSHRVPGRLPSTARSSSATSTTAAAQVRAWKESPLSYGLLADLNTVPRTTYVAALRNPNPDLEGA